MLYKTVSLRLDQSILHFEEVDSWYEHFVIKHLKYQGLGSMWRCWIQKRLQLSFPQQILTGSAQVCHMRAACYHSWHAAQTAAMAQEQRIYCSTEDGAHWQPAEQYNYWSTKREPGNQRVLVCVCWNRWGIDHRSQPSPCAASWPGQLTAGTWMSHDRAAMPGIHALGKLNITVVTLYHICSQNRKTANTRALSQKHEN